MEGYTVRRIRRNDKRITLIETGTPGEKATVVRKVGTAWHNLAVVIVPPDDEVTIGCGKYEVSIIIEEGTISDSRYPRIKAVE